MSWGWLLLAAFTFAGAVVLSAVGLFPSLWISGPIAFGLGWAAAAGVEKRRRRRP